MNARTASLMAAVLAIAPLAASADDSVAQLARETGLSERNLRMVLGARTPYVEYRTQFDRVTWDLKRAIGNENYRRLMNGEDIVLERRAAPDDDKRAVAAKAPAVNKKGTGAGS
ncbi:hypothetical protein [Pseudoxanthomonas sp. Root630]|uniref:hypothetical protein n=1 Tax=Pseudoxanthomonas sp. Root630 TaxID=1736574 RepID=UPI000A9F417D|nr:hypothetical protein [Pseudoxanthomonas sp. Root630]